MFVKLLLVRGGHKKVLLAFDYYRGEMKEQLRFETLVSSLTYPSSDRDYKVSEYNQILSSNIQFQNLVL